jgi:hypothetical protein
VRLFLTCAALAVALGAIGSPAEAAGAVAVSPVTLFPATSGIYYRAVVTASGGTGPYAYSVVAGKLPLGVTLAGDGTISGVPDDAPGLFSFTVRALDATGGAATQALTFELATPMVLLTSTAVPAARVGDGYRYVLVATGGSPGYVYSLADGSLPDGLVLASNGVISGSPKAAGVSLFTMQIIDAHGVRGVQTFRFVVHKAKPAPKKTRLRPRR